MKATILKGGMSAAVLSMTPAAAVAGDNSGGSEWDGLYFGGHSGMVKGAGDLSTITSGPHTFNQGGVLGGFQLGYNWSYEEWVFGLEADYTVTDFLTAHSGHRLSIDSIATLRARLGMELDSGDLVYATAGVGYMHGVSTSTDGGVDDYKEDSFRFTIGAGYETHITENCSVKLEAIDLIGSDSWRVGSNDRNVIDNVFMARIGLNFHF